MHDRREKKVRKRVVFSFLVFVLIIGGVFFGKLGKYFPALIDLIFKKEIQLKTTDQKKVNILFLGIGGGTHDGPQLTDTMIFATIDPKVKKVTLISIPRDFWSPQLQAKINAAYAFGEAKKEGGGLKLAKATVSDILGQPIDYGLRVDFAGFVKAVDMVGGLDVDVERAFDDYKYPLNGKEDELCGREETEIASLSAQIATGSADELEVFPCRYEHLRFEKGLQKMDGITALKFVRSRHGLNGEGSDFARSERQEKVIAAFKNKVFSVDTFLNPVNIISLAEVFDESIDTDIKENEYDDFIKLAKELRGVKITSAVLDVGDEEEERFGLLVEGFLSNQYVLVPRVGSGKYEEIQKYVKCKIDNGSCMVGSSGIVIPTVEPSKSVKEN